LRNAAGSTDVHLINQGFAVRFNFPLLLSPLLIGRGYSQGRWVGKFLVPNKKYRCHHKVAGLGRPKSRPCATDDRMRSDTEKVDEAGSPLQSKE